MSEGNKVVVVIDDPVALRKRNANMVAIIFILLTILGFSSAANLAFWKAWLNRKPDMVATTADLRVIPVVKVTRAVVSQSRLEEFTQQAWRKVYSFSFRTYDDSLHESRPYFCASTYDDLKVTLDPIYTRVKQERLVVSWIQLSGPAVTRTNTLDDGRPQYVLEGVATIRYEGKTEEAHQWKFITLVEPVDDIDNPFGVCISRFNFLPSRQGS